LKKGFKKVTVEVPKKSKHPRADFVQSMIAREARRLSINKIIPIFLLGVGVGIMISIMVTLAMK
jgi:hypothetical protein